jgi:general secretion pathway protein F
MQFQVKTVLLVDGSVSERRVVAVDESELRSSLESHGYAVLTVQRAADAKRKSGNEPKDKYPVFCREIRTLIQAGMTIVEAVDTLSARARLEGRPDSLSAELLSRLQQGQSLSVALSSLPDVSMVLVAAVRAGERTSNLVEALDDYLRYDTMIVGLRQKLISAAIYPAVVTALGLGISVFLLTVVMPNFARMYDNLQSGRAGRASFMIVISQFMAQYRVAVLIGLVLLVCVLVYWVRSGAAKRWMLQLAQENAWLKSRIADFELAMMYQALTLLLKGGYPMTEAMGVATQSALSKQLKSGLTVAMAQVERGGSLSQALSDAKLCDEVGRRLMAAAERNGDFHLAADVVSRMHGERFELFVGRMTRIIEPVLLLGVALIVGGIVVMMYLPVFEMATRLK